MIYRLRLLFDPGSGVCLWAANDAARQRYGYPVDHRQLPLTENTSRWLTHLVAWFDTSLDWCFPMDSDGLWTEAELQSFQMAKQRGLDLLRQDLPSTEFEIGV